MKIKMLDTCENSHPYIDSKDGKLVVKYDVRVFTKDSTYDGSDHKPDMNWIKRAESLVNLGFAEEV